MFWELCLRQKFIRGLIEELISDSLAFARYKTAELVVDVGIVVPHIKLNKVYTDRIELAKGFVKFGGVLAIELLRLSIDHVGPVYVDYSNMYYLRLREDV